MTSAWLDQRSARAPSGRVAMCNGSRARETFAIGAVLGCLLALVHADELDRHDGQSACTQINSQLEAEILAQRREILELTAELESCQRGERKLKDHGGLELNLSPLSARVRGIGPLWLSRTVA